MADNHQRIPVEVIFNPNWWFRHYGISFNQPFYLDKETRLIHDIVWDGGMYTFADEISNVDRCRSPGGKRILVDRE
jgi:hypothetical protein